MGTALSLCLYEMQPELHSRVPWGEFDKYTEPEILVQLWVGEGAGHGVFLKLYPTGSNVTMGILVRRVKTGQTDTPARILSVTPRGTCVKWTFAPLRG